MEKPRNAANKGHPQSRGKRCQRHLIVAKSNASTTSRYVYAGFNQLLAEQTNGQWSSYIYNGSEPLALIRNNQVYSLHTDHLGRPQLATNASQQPVWKAATTAFDRTVTQDSMGGLNLGFPGQYLDTESGIWHNGYRDYLADAGRYLQSDPIGLAGGVNTYAYVGGNPVGYIDPLGLQSQANWFNPNASGTLYLGASSYRSPPGVYTISAHGWVGTLFTMGPNGERLSPKQVWEKISDDYKRRKTVSETVNRCR